MIETIKDVELNRKQDTATLPDKIARMIQAMRRAFGGSSSCDLSEDIQWCKHATIAVEVKEELAANNIAANSSLKA